MSFRYCLTAICFAFTLLAACTTAPTSTQPPTTNLTATAEDISIRQTHVVATATSIQLTIEAGQSATLPSTVTEPALTAVPTEQPAVTTAPTLQPTIVPATATPLPAGNPPTDTPQPSSPPIVKSFTVDKTQIDGGDQLTFTWETANATDITLVHAQPNGQLGNLGATGLSTSGSVTILTNPETVNTHTFYLNLTGPGGQVTSESVHVKFNCKSTWFFGSDPGYCATQSPETKTVIEQPFEGGLMLWLPINNWHDIYALYNDGTMITTVDYWTSTDPESDPSIVPPEGRYQPVRGFGQVWRGPYGVREKLGWATGLEHSYATTYQDEAGGTDWKGWNIFIRLSDGRVIHVIGHYANYKWEYISP